MADDKPVLGKSLGKMITDLTDLILATTDADKKEELRAQHRELTKKLQDLIDNTVPTDTEEYKQATAAVVTANDAIRQAVKDASQVADTITKVAKVVSVLAKLIAVLG